MDQELTLDKLTSTKKYSILIARVQDKPFSNIYFDENQFGKQLLYKDLAHNK